MRPAALSRTVTAETVDKGQDAVPANLLPVPRPQHGELGDHGRTTCGKFPIDQPDRFFNSVTNGKNNMPSFKGALEPGAIQWLWAYVSTRGGKEM